MTTVQAHSTNGFQHFQSDKVLQILGGPLHIYELPLSHSHFNIKKQGSDMKQEVCLIWYIFLHAHCTFTSLYSIFLLSYIP
jgi:hypothetical protein